MSLTSKTDNLAEQDTPSVPQNKILVNKSAFDSLVHDSEALKSLSFEMLALAKAVCPGHYDDFQQLFKKRFNANCGPLHCYVKGLVNHETKKESTLNIVPDIKIIKNEISSVKDLKDLKDQFKSVFGSDEARNVRNIVYFFLASNPIPRFKGQSRILYIGRTTGTLHQRYFKHCGTLANQHNGAFYQDVIESYGGIQIGYVESDNPKEDEKLYFKKYYSNHLEYPPKSKT